MILPKMLRMKKRASVLKKQRSRTAMIKLHTENASTDYKRAT